MAKLKLEIETARKTPIQFLVDKVIEILKTEDVVSVHMTKEL